MNGICELCGRSGRDESAARVGALKDQVEALTIDLHVERRAALRGGKSAELVALYNATIEWLDASDELLRPDWRQNQQARARRLELTKALHDAALIVLGPVPDIRG